jgi:NADH:ubiquinone oxidoreductase subunit 4 (subunit M)
VVITAVYMLRVVRGTFFGPSKAEWAHVTDAVTPFARLPYVLLIAALMVVGCWPKPFLRLIDASARPLAGRAAASTAETAPSPVVLSQAAGVSAQVPSK